jgi:hypothetical protein
MREIDKLEVKRKCRGKKQWKIRMGGRGNGIRELKIKRHRMGKQRDKRERS